MCFRLGYFTTESRMLFKIELFLSARTVLDVVTSAPPY